MGAVDYVPVPVIPEVLRAKVKIFAELYRKTRQLERLNRELEHRVAERTAELGSVAARLMRASSAAAWRSPPARWDRGIGTRSTATSWDDGQYRIFGVDPGASRSPSTISKALIHPEDWKHLQNAIKPACAEQPGFQTEFRVCRPNGELRWCIGTAVASVDATDKVVRISGVTVDITDRKEAEERQALLAREVDHRARNALALVQSIVRLTRARHHQVLHRGGGRADRGAVARAHAAGAEPLAGRRSRPPGRRGACALSHRRRREDRRSGPDVSLEPRTAQTLALALHELSTNAAKYGALSVASGRVVGDLGIATGQPGRCTGASGGPVVKAPATPGFGIG